MDILRLKQLQFFGLHGTEPWEKEVGRRFVVDVELTYEMTREGRSDKLDDAIDYRDIYAAVRDVVAGESHQLVERVAWRVLESLFERFPRADAVWVKVAKSEAPIGGLNDAVEIEIGRTLGEMRELLEDSEAENKAED